jgi:hypothetical protein
MEKELKSEVLEVFLFVIKVPEWVETQRQER